jgi:hypothetical protein
MSDVYRICATACDCGCRAPRKYCLKLKSFRGLWLPDEGRQCDLRLRFAAQTGSDAAIDVDNRF